MWEFSSHQSGGYPMKSFTAEFRRYTDIDVSNETERIWQRLDPHNIPANVVKCNFIRSMTQFICNLTHEL